MAKTRRQFARSGRNKLGQFYADAHNKIIATLLSKQSTIDSRRRAKQLLVEINDVIDRLDERTQAFIAKQIPKNYMLHAEVALKEARKFAKDVRFTKIHEEAIQAFVDRSQLEFATALQVTKRKAQQLVSRTLQENITRIIAREKILGGGLEPTASEVTTLLKNQGITGLVDKRGRNLNIESYAKTLVYTQFAESGRLAVNNVALQNGFDLVRISSHNSSHAECRVWEGRVVSITGATKGFPTLEEVKASGWGHPGCQHTYTIVDPMDAEDLY